MDRRAFLTALMGALAAPAAPALVSLKEPAQAVYPAGSRIAVELVSKQFFERPYSYFVDSGVFTAEYDFCATALFFEGDDLTETQVELIVNGKPLQSAPLPAFYLGGCGLPLLCPPIMIPKGTTVEYRCHGRDARMFLSGCQLLTQAEIEAMPETVEYETDGDEIDAEFIDEEDD